MTYMDREREGSADDCAPLLEPCPVDHCSDVIRGQACPNQAWLSLEPSWTHAATSAPGTVTKWVDLFGADPDYCEGMDVGDWLEKNRGDA